MLMRYRKILAILTLCVFCTGCWDSTEIDQLAIVIASGVDLVQDDTSKQPQVLGTIQIALPSQLGTNGGGAPSTQTGTTSSFVLEQAKATNPLATVDIMRKQLSRKLFMGQRRVIIIGEDYARKGVYDLADEIIRNPQSRLRSYVVVAYHDKAEDILKMPYPLNRLPADAISDLETQGAVPEVDAKRLLQGLSSNGDPFLLGVEQVQTLHSVADSKSGSFALTHIAIFRKDKLVGWLSGPQLRGFIWIFGRLQREDSTVNIPGVPGFITSRMLDIDTSRKIKVVNGKLKIQIKVRTEYDIAENGTPINLNNPANIERVKKALTEEIKGQVESTMDTLQHQYHADPFGFADKLYSKHPGVWKQLKGTWTGNYSKAPVSVLVSVDIRNSGLTGPSIRS